MDFSLITAASASLNTARELGRAALAVRDFNEMATIVAKLNDQLLKAQDSLFTHNAQLLALQDEMFKAREELREMREAKAERAQYTLFEIAKGQFVYRFRADHAPVAGGSGDPVLTKPLHYLCQKCFDKDGVKIVLQRNERMGAYVTLDCTNCHDSVPLSGSGD